MRRGTGLMAGSPTARTSHVRVVAGVFEGACFGVIVDQPAELKAHLHHLALGQGDAHRVAVCTGEQQTRCRQAGRGGAAASGQATAQRGGLFAGFFTHRPA